MTASLEPLNAKQQLVKIALVFIVMAPTLDRSVLEAQFDGATLPGHV